MSYHKRTFAIQLTTTLSGTQELPHDITEEDLNKIVYDIKRQVENFVSTPATGPTAFHIIGTRAIARPTWRHEVKGCKTCDDNWGEFHPSHDAGPHCESGGRVHCTCDSCF